MVSQASFSFVIMNLTRISRLRNLPRGRAFDEDALSADYNMHVEFSYMNYREWSTKKDK